MKQRVSSIRTQAKSSHSPPKKASSSNRGPVFSPTAERAAAVAAAMCTESAPPVVWSPEEAEDLQDALGNRAADELVTENGEPEAGEEEESGMDAEEAVEDKSEVGVDEDLVLPATGAPPVVMTANFVDLGRVGTARYGDTSSGNPGHVAHAFVNVGQTGTVIWGGGGGAGARGNEPVGSIQFQYPPVYQSRSLGPLSDSEAWVSPLTGFLVVVRSWVGINGGNQGNGHFVTPAAAARINQHKRRSTSRAPEDTM